MADDEDWFFRPWVEGKCLYESLKNGDLDLEDVKRMNHALDVYYENRRRYQEIQDRGRQF